MDCFKMAQLHSPGETEKNQEKSIPKQPVVRPRFELGAS